MPTRRFQVLFDSFNSTIIANDEITHYQKPNDSQMQHHPGLHKVQIHLGIVEIPVGILRIIVEAEDKTEALTIAFELTKLYHKNKSG